MPDALTDTTKHLDLFSRIDYRVTLGRREVYYKQLEINELIK